MGDVKNKLLDVSKLESHGWKPKHNGKQAIKQATRHLTNELQPILVLSVFFILWIRAAKLCKEKENALIASEHPHLGLLALL